jgi:hypothetical protein
VLALPCQLKGGGQNFFSAPAGDENIMASWKHYHSLKAVALHSRRLATKNSRQSSCNRKMLSPGLPSSYHYLYNLISTPH